MATFNIIRLSELEIGKRIDAECYQYKKWNIDQLIRKRNHILLGKIIVSFSSGHNLPQKDFCSGCQPFIRTQNVRPILIDDNGLTATLEVSKTQVEKGDILAVRVGEGVGNVSVVGTNFSGSAFSDNVLRIKVKNINPYFVVVFLNTGIGRLILSRFSKGTARSLISYESFINIPIPIFSKKFCKFIEILVENAYSKVEESKSLYTQSEQLLLSELGLKNWKPKCALTFVRSYSQVAKAGRMDAEYFHPKFKQMLHMISSQVKFDRLGRLTTYIKGVEVGSDAYTDSGIPFWRVSNLSKYGLVDSNVNFISQDLYKALSQNYEPRQGEILLSKDATPGIAYYLEHQIQGIVSSGILRLKITDIIPPHYLELILNSFFVQMQIEQDVGGSIIKHWKSSDVLKTLIPRLSNANEEKIASLVQQSHSARHQAKFFLEIAKQAVEIAIEYNENVAIKFVKDILYNFLYNNFELHQLV